MRYAHRIPLAGRASIHYEYDAFVGNQVGRPGAIKHVSDQGRRDMLSYRQSWGLAVGINNYPDNPLTHAVTDAAAVAQCLREMSFSDVSSLSDDDAALGSIRKCMFDHIGAHANEHDRVVMYFAGHGLFRRGREAHSVGYLVPAGAKHDAEVSQLLPMFELHTWLQQCRAKHVLILLDCCYSGLAGRTRDLVTQERNWTEDMVRAVAAKPSCQIIAASDASQPAYESAALASAGSGHFASAVLKALEGGADPGGRGFFTGSELFEYVRERVLTATRTLQRPIIHRISGDGEIIFKSLPARARPAVIDASRRVSPAPRSSQPTSLRERLRRAPDADDVTKVLDALADEICASLATTEAPDAIDAAASDAIAMDPRLWSRTHRGRVDVGRTWPNKNWMNTPWDEWAHPPTEPAVGACDRWGLHAVIAGQGGSASVVDLVAGTVLCMWQGLCRSSSPVPTAAALTDDLSYAATAYSDGSIVVVNVPAAQIVASATIADGPSTLRFVRKKRELIIGTRMPFLLHWRWPTQERPVRLSENATARHRAGLVDFDVAPDGRAIVSAGTDGELLKWPIDGGQPTVLTKQLGSVRSVRFFAKGEKLATLDALGRVQLSRIAQPSVSQGTFAVSANASLVTDGRVCVLLTAGGPRPPLPANPDLRHVELKHLYKRGWFAAGIRDRTLVVLHRGATSDRLCLSQLPLD
jgi:hypothetical protein